MRVADHLEHDALRGDMVPVPAQPGWTTPLPLLDLRQLSHRPSPMARRLLTRRGLEDLAGCCHESLSSNGGASPSRVTGPAGRSSPVDTEAVGSSPGVVDLGRSLDLFVPRQGSQYSRHALSSWASM
jgi:hypothetical protein